MMISREQGIYPCASWAALDRQWCVFIHSDIVHSVSAFILKMEPFCKVEAHRARHSLRSLPHAVQRNLEPSTARSSPSVSQEEGWQLAEEGRCVGWREEAGSPAF